MSLYLMLTSEGSKETYPNNHGGDFKVQLDHVYDFRTHPWEVAIVEMSYTGQVFNNLSTDSKSVTVRASGKPIFENNYIITYDQSVGLSLYMHVSDRSNITRSAKIVFPRQHYTWESFRDTFINLYQKQFCKDIRLTDDTITLSEGYASPAQLKNFTLELSPSFIKLFNIDPKYKRTHDHAGGWVHYILPFKKPIALTDNSKVIYTPYAKNKDMSILIGDERVLELIPQYWTVNMLQRALETISNDNIKSISTSGGYITITPIKSKWSTLPIYFSYYLHKLLNTSAVAYFIEDFDKPLKIAYRFEVCAEEEDIKWHSYTATRRLPKESYVDVSSLISDINKVAYDCQIDIAQQRNIPTLPFTFFSVSNDVVSFSEKDGFEVQLDLDVLKMLHLPNIWLSKSIVGTKSVILKSRKRSHFYIHCDCLDYYYVNNLVSDLLMTITNIAPIDEKIVLPFHDPQYHAVSRRHVNHINMYITDGLFDKVLTFDREVIYTLHFRKCSIDPFL